MSWCSNRRQGEGVWLMHLRGGVTWWHSRLEELTTKLLPSTVGVYASWWGLLAATSRDAIVDQIQVDAGMHSRPKGCSTKEAVVVHQRKPRHSSPHPHTNHRNASRKLKYLPSCSFSVFTHWLQLSKVLLSTNSLRPSSTIKSHFTSFSRCNPHDTLGPHHSMMVLVLWHATAVEYVNFWKWNHCLNSLQPPHPSCETLNSSSQLGKWFLSDKSSCHDKVVYAHFPLRHGIYLSRSVMQSNWSCSALFPFVALS